MLPPSRDVVVPGSADGDGTCRIVSDTLRAAHAPAPARIVSAGALLLPPPESLDERPATTHSRWAENFSAAIPAGIRPNRLFVDDGDVLTSAGVTTGIDWPNIIRRDNGAADATAGTRARAPTTSRGQRSSVERCAGGSGEKLARFVLECSKTGTAARPRHARHARTQARRTLPRFRERRMPTRRGSPMRASTAPRVLEITTNLRELGRLTYLALRLCPAAFQGDSDLARLRSVSTPPEPSRERRSCD